MQAVRRRRTRSRPCERSSESCGVGRRMRYSTPRRRAACARAGGRDQVLILRDDQFLECRRRVRVTLRQAVQAAELRARPQDGVVDADRETPTPPASCALCRRNAVSRSASALRRCSVRSRRILTKPIAAPASLRRDIISPLAQKRSPLFLRCQRSSMPRPRSGRCASPGRGSRPHSLRG